VRYRRLRAHARGGLGEVFVALDGELSREVALKEIQDRFADHPGHRARFLREAEVTGKLEHPGVVPVYGLGVYTDGRPYYAMRFIRGESMHDALRRFHQADERPGRDPGERSLALRELLGRFVAVCNAVGYAHVRGVIHRDIKPANVMLGEYGETLVVDWGLSRVLDQPESEATVAEKPILLGSGSGSTPTEVGQVVGTPGFMPPEQAQGQHDRVGVASDVFSLGATLYTLLTGQAPYSGEDVLAQARRGEIVPARQRKRSVPPALEAICQKAMAKRPEDRYPTARVLADEVQRWLAGEPVQAWPEPWVVKAGRWVRKHRVLATSTVAALVVTLVLGSAGALWWQRQRQQAGVAANEAMSEARLRLRDERFDEALAAAQKAEELARTAGAAEAVRRQAKELVEVVGREATAARRDRRLLAALLEVRSPREGPKYRSDHKGVMAELLEPSADEQFAAAFRDWDPTFDVDSLSTEEAAERLRARPARVRVEVVAALDEWASERRQQKMPAAKWRRLADLAAALDDATNSRQAELRRLLARDTLQRERALGALAMALRPVPVPFDAGLGHDRQRLHRLVERTDVRAEPVLGLLTLSRALQAAGDDLLAERLLGAAVQARPQEVALQSALGRLRAGQERWKQAVGCHAAARALRPELGADLANALVNSGSVREGMALYERLAVQPNNPWLRLVHGIALSDQGRHKKAEAAFRQAIRLNPDYYTAHGNLGNALFNQGRHKEAEAAYRQAIRLKPNDPKGHNNLGGALDSQGRHKEAETAYREAIRLKPDFPRAHHNLGLALNYQGRYKEAEGAFRESIRLKPDHAEAHYHLGLMLSRQGRHTEAEAAYRQALHLRPDYPEAHCNLGGALRDQGRFSEALQSLRRGHALGSARPGWRNPSAAWVRHCQRLVELDRLLNVFLKGDAEPASALERLELASLCQMPCKRLHLTASRLAADAFTAEPKRADDLRQQYRYNAACSAALAAAGQAEDARFLPDRVALKLRLLTLRWLKADLALYAKLCEHDDPRVKQVVRQRLTHWRQGSDLGAVRDPAALRILPEAEQVAWLNLWSQVDALLARTMPSK
jgi:Flp pilus assembly protein TadD/tRNA A-37 threonylcarbamoyl transferase component Bud32